jgi:hypothetical protein
MPLAVNRFLPADYTKIAKICERMPRNRFITSKKKAIIYLIQATPISSRA